MLQKEIVFIVKSLANIAEQAANCGVGGGGGRGGGGGGGGGGSIVAQRGGVVGKGQWVSPYDKNILQ